MVVAPFSDVKAVRRDIMDFGFEGAGAGAGARVEVGFWEGPDGVRGFRSELEGALEELYRILRPIRAINGPVGPGVRDARHCRDTVYVSLHS